MTASRTLALLTPELIVFLGAMLVLALDLLWRGDERRWLPWVALSPVAVALFLTFALWGTEESIFYGMMAVDPLSLYFKLIACSATILVILASSGYIKKRAERQGEFYVLLLLAALAVMLATSASNLIMLYLAFEFLSLVSYVLVSYLRGDSLSSEAGVKYFLYGAVTSALMLYGMSLLYGATGTTDLAGIAESLRGTAAATNWLAIPTAIMLLAGFSFKIAIAPFHQWAPDAYEGAPTPVTAFLSVASKMTGFAVLTRVMVVAMGDFQPSWARVLGAFAIVSMVLGNFVALQQSNIKRMLAYSSIAHAGYMMIGVVTYVLVPGVFTGLNGVLLYAMVYLFTNIGAFLAVIAVEEETGSVTISDYAGLSSRSLFLAAILAYFLLSLTGMPLTGGMFAKFFVFAPAMQAGSFGFLLAAVGIVASVVGAFYYLNVVRYMFFVPGQGLGGIKLSVALRIGLIIAAVITLIIGVYPQPFIQLATRSVTMLGALVY